MRYPLRPHARAAPRPLRDLHASVRRPSRARPDPRVLRPAARRLPRARHGDAPLGWIPITERFDDEGESGGDTCRPALERLLEAVVEGRFDRVLVHRLDRLTRRAADWARIDDIFRANGVAISVVDGGHHGASDAITRFRLNALAIFAEFERDMITERLRDGRAARRARGLRVAGRPPLGYVADRSTKQLVVVPAEAEIVRALFADADAGVLPAMNAPRANEKGLVDKNGKSARWSAKAVLRILRNETYAGLLRGGSAGVHAAIVERALFERVGEKIAGRRTLTPTLRPQREDAVDPFLLRGLLVCASCGKRMTTSSTGKVERQGRRAFRQIALCAFVLTLCVRKRGDGPFAVSMGGWSCFERAMERRAPDWMTIFATLPDPRVERTRRHKLVDIITLVLIGVLGGCRAWDELHDYAAAGEAQLGTILELPNGIPSADTLRRVIGLWIAKRFAKRSWDGRDV